LLLDAKLGDELQEELKQISGEIVRLETLEGSIVVSGRIDSSNYWGHALLRPKFSFRKLAGDIAELRLHCVCIEAGGMSDLSSNQS